MGIWKLSHQVQVAPDGLVSLKRLEKPPQPTPRDTKSKYGKFQPLVTRHNIWVITEFLFITMGLVDTARMSGNERALVQLL